MLHDVFSFLNSGGPVLYFILLATVVLWVLIIERFWFFYREAPRLCSEMKSNWANLSSHDSWVALKIRDRIISRVTIQFSQYRSFIQLLVVVCPLLGLLGTVTGMINVFDVMAITGTGNARAMASGISMATIPTMAGMVVSLMGLYFIARFDSLSKKQLEAFKDALIK
ncbi:MotA/TolQ/ExbB proton channel family protein [Oceaniserpentilla sp. 4NH20-0058]|uniref:MotA/TolQ/ExbB proton channel family protein n=1 Tax=Oceaniserpentilla sp. 4NH20-0058 TaxID=3127660 RepID=UPI00310AA909